MNQNPAKRSYRKFDETFKRQAVQNWLSSGKSAEIVAQELDPNVRQIRSFCQRVIGRTNVISRVGFYDLYSLIGKFSRLRA